MSKVFLIRSAFRALRPQRPLTACPVAPRDGDPFPAAPGEAHRDGFLDLDAQTIVVTGASSGVGLATARMAVARGACVVLVARDGAVLEAETARMAAKGGRAAFAVADVGDRAAVEAAARRAVEAFGGFDTWVNVAGITIYGNL